MQHLLLGIDPGFASLGYALYDIVQGQFVSAGVVRTKKDTRKSRLVRDDNVCRYNELWAALENIWPNGTDRVVHAVCSEGMSQPRNSGAAWKLALGWGAVLGIARSKGVPVFQVSPQALKKAVAGKPSASKNEVIGAVKALIHTWPKAKGLWEHQADAMAAVLALVDSPDLSVLKTALK